MLLAKPEILYPKSTIIETKVESEIKEKYIPMSFFDNSLPIIGIETIGTKIVIKYDTIPMERFII
ncbi:hypothetical protein GCM10008939_22730 [Deinococcus aquiradiocola]|uniref:Uncharacterized protein n=1 Tax=Deinococcus aquiradiocola TaxID=393059 RepID=A0A917PHK0_9DEIO|nr:hypothetical protein GCM10008939_22730 [Deinococcus aquiradiocola]